MDLSISLIPFLLQKVNLIDLKKGSALFLCLLAMQTVLAQLNKKTIQLSEVSAVAQKPLPFESGKKAFVIDSLRLALSSNLSLIDLLNRETGFSFKSYGVNGIISPALRGSAADHTAFMWNGMNLQSPTHGQFDLSLFPSFFIQQLSIEPGAATGSFGSGAIGGAIILNNTAQKQPQGFSAQALLSGGSFGKKQAGLSLTFTNIKWQHTVKAYRLRVHNNYTIPKFYSAEYNAYFLLNAKQRQTKGALEQDGLSTENSYTINSNSSISNTFLYVNTNRPVINSNGKQWDQNLRNASNYKFEKGKTQFSAVLGLQQDHLHYNDENSRIYSRSISQSALVQANINYRLRQKDHVYLSANSQFISAQVDGYGSAKIPQNRQSVWGGYQKYWLNARLKTDVGFRQQLIDGKKLPFNPVLGTDFRVNTRIKLKAHSAKTYHAPDLNDLYWQQGGNPNLVAEQGWSHEGGISYKHRELSSTLTYFSSKTNNLIVWLPGKDFWSPINVKKVWSRGFEYELTYRFKLAKQQFDLKGNYGYTKSETIESVVANDETVGKQLLYIPKHKFSASLLYSMQQYTAYLSFSAYGKNFVYSNNSAWLPAYQLVNLRLGKRINYRDFTNEFFVQVNNLSNHFYQSQPGYAMPGRNFEIGINLKINK